MSGETSIKSARDLKAKKSSAHTSQVQIHISAESTFHEAFLAALKQLRYQTQAEFFREKMREAISHAEKIEQTSRKVVSNSQRKDRE